MTAQTPRDGTPPRRTFIAASGTALLGSTAGCTAVVNFIGSQILEQVNVFNETNQPVTGAITIVDPAGDTVLDETFDLAASDSEESDNESSSSDENQSLAVYDDVWTESGSYEVAVELDSEIDGQSQANGTVTIDTPDEQKLAAALGTDDADRPIDFRVGKSLSEFGD
ncbi:hypothetical protein SAMN04488556_3410 [Halostagnicola kamekurae]|uniref:Uncharacterized protein n=2 Tax=Halostagnicola kamekurae TaxID=619731 RepID=A0A1I6TSZ8_9EURY|nr:hypothetical protein SAMN04488556_3410 [Halostagnicola kamekurae]